MKEIKRECIDRSMRNLRFFLFLFAFSILLCFTALWNSKNERKETKNIASYSYQGPTQPVPGNPRLVRVEVLVRDSPQAAGVQIKSVEFDGNPIPLQPRDIYGNRGSGSFQVPPGKYTLRWVVERDKLLWPRNLKHEEEVTIDPRDLWLQIEIIGEEASIR